jgi:hypothetical protein
MKFEKRGPKGKKKWVCYNEKELIFTYREAQEKHGITQRRFRDALDQLIEHGLLDVIEAGNAATLTPTKYGICKRWLNYGTDEYEANPRIKAIRGYCDQRKRFKRPPGQNEQT